MVTRVIVRVCRRVASIAPVAFHGLCARGGVKVALYPSRLKGGSFTEPEEFFVVQGGSYGWEFEYYR